MICFVQFLQISCSRFLTSFQSQAMYLLSVACVSGFILGTSTLNLAPQGSIATFSDFSTSTSSSFELLSPSNQSASWSNSSFTPARPPSLAANSSALQALGLNAEELTTWLTTPSGNVIGVQCNVRYGRRLDYQDCRDAHRYIPRSDHRVARFAWRRSGTPHEIALPLRALGSMSTPASCLSHWLMAGAIGTQPR